MELTFFMCAGSREVGDGVGLSGESIRKPVAPCILVAAAISLCRDGQYHPHFLHSPQSTTNTSWCIIGFCRG